MHSYKHKMKKTSIFGALILFIVGGLVISGCCKASISTSTIVSNNSGEDVTLRFYPDSNVRETIEDVFLKKDSIFKNPSGSTLPNFIPSFYQLDSMTVDFDGKKIVTHYPKGKIGNGSTSISWDNPRNLFNEYNYRRDVITDKKCAYYEEFHYTFAPEDAK